MGTINWWGLSPAADLLAQVNRREEIAAAAAAAAVEEEEEEEPPKIEEVADDADDAGAGGDSSSTKVVAAPADWGAPASEWPEGHAANATAAASDEAGYAAAAAAADAAATDDADVEAPTGAGVFIAAEKFRGAKAGYKFTTGKQGTGYYKDTPAPSAAATASPAASAKAKTATDGPQRQDILIAGGGDVRHILRTMAAHRKTKDAANGDELHFWVAEPEMG
jgi:hypothetical protein